MKNLATFQGDTLTQGQMSSLQGGSEISIDTIYDAGTEALVSEIYIDTVYDAGTEVNDH